MGRGRLAALVVESQVTERFQEHFGTLVLATLLGGVGLAVALGAHVQHFLGSHFSLHQLLVTVLTDGGLGVESRVGHYARTLTLHTVLELRHGTAPGVVLLVLLGVFQELGTAERVLLVLSTIHLAVLFILVLFHQTAAGETLVGSLVSGNDFLTAGPVIRDRRHVALVTHGDLGVVRVLAAVLHHF